MKKQTKMIALASSAGAIAFFAYRLYVTYKQLKAEGYIFKEVTPEEIKSDPKPQKKERFAEDIVKEYEELKKIQQQSIEEMYEEEEDIQHDEADDLEFDELVTNEEYDEIEVSELNTQISDEEAKELMEEGADEVLRHDPESTEAFEQYKNMRLAEFDTIKGPRRTLERLFQYEFIPKNEIDRNLQHSIHEERAIFFGNSSYTDVASFAEVVLHFAELLNFDLDYSIEYWTDYILMNVAIRPGTGEATASRIIEDISGHVWWYNGLYGIFGLSEDDYGELVRQSPHVPDEEMTFLKQYHMYISKRLETEDVR